MTTSIIAKNYEVNVGNIGTVYSGPSKDVAQAIFNEYVKKSRNGEGRGAYEDVFLEDEHGESVCEFQIWPPDSDSTDPPPSGSVWVSRDESL